MAEGAASGLAADGASTEQTTGSAPAAGSGSGSGAAPPGGDDEPRARAGSTGRRKKNRRGRGKRRRWKPYYKLSWAERRELEERESRRANRLRQRMFAHGQPVAPYNTTQFLMEDHCVQEPDYESRNAPRRREDSVNSPDSSDEFYSSPEDEDDFLQKQFSEAYDDVHAERLSSMGKAELVQEYLLLEDRVEQLEQQLRAARGACRADAHTQTDGEQQQKLAVFRDEIRRLADENALVRAQNRALRDAQGDKPC